jgi:hypothetical protein
MVVVVVVVVEIRKKGLCYFSCFFMLGLKGIRNLFFLLFFLVSWKDG